MVNVFDRMMEEVLSVGECSGDGGGKNRGGVCVRFDLFCCMFSADSTVCCETETDTGRKVCKSGRPGMSAVFL